MRTIAVILARAGSKGLPDKCVLPLCGRPVVAYSITHAQQSAYVDDIVLTTDSPRAMAVGRAAGVTVIERPPELAGDTAPVCAAVRHAVEQYENATGERVDVVVILYGNTPIRAEGTVDAVVEHLVATGCDSVRTLVRIGKQHPDWLHRLEDDRMVQYRQNTIDRRQDLEPLYYNNGSAIAVRRDCLFTPESYQNPHAFFGADRRAIVQEEDETVEIDCRADFYRAEAILRDRSESVFAEPSGGSRRPFTGAVSVSVAYDRR